MRKISYTADFETTTTAPTHVWAYAIMQVGQVDNFIIGTSIDDFFEKVRELYGGIFYFHNLKFDGCFILDYLLKNGFEHVRSNDDLSINKFTTLISDRGVFYSMKIRLKGFKRKQFIDVEIRDSLKLLPFSVDKIAKDFKLPVKKLELDYETYREENGVLTPYEKEYIKCDVEIMSRALAIFFGDGYKKITIGSNALAEYKKMVGKRFDKLFPMLPLEVDDFCRHSYRGGWTYCNSEFAEKDIENFMVLDVNSLYPSRMRYCEFPVGEPIYYKGCYENDKLYPLYIQHLTCQFEIKPHHLPCIQLKGTLGFTPTEYLSDSDGEIVELFLTNIDLELIKQQYDLYDVTYIDGFKFKKASGLFNEYVDGYTDKKIKAKEIGDASHYVIAKLFLNNLYGKFSTNPYTRQKIPYLEDGMVKFFNSEIEMRDTVYLPVGAFTTAHARYMTITHAQKIENSHFENGTYERFLYADTDSIHYSTQDFSLLPYFEVDSTKLGAWDLELIGCKARYLRAKTYIENALDEKQLKKVYHCGIADLCDGKHADLIRNFWSENNFNKVTCAGLPAKLHKNVNFDNFHNGTTYADKLVFKHVQGGVILNKTNFNIKIKK